LKCRSKSVGTAQIGAAREEQCHWIFLRFNSYVTEQGGATASGELTRMIFRRPLPKPLWNNSWRIRPLLLHKSRLKQRLDRGAHKEDRCAGPRVSFSGEETDGSDGRNLRIEGDEVGKVANEHGVSTIHREIEVTVNSVRPRRDNHGRRLLDTGRRSGRRTVLCDASCRFNASSIQAPERQS